MNTPIALAALLLSLTIPTTTGTALDGHTVTLPRNLSAPATILIIGFSHASADATTAWEKPIRTAGLPFYDIAFLQDAPSLLRPLILSHIRKQVPDVLKPNFLTLTTDEAAWKQTVSFSSSAPDAAYILLIDPSGAVHYQTHEPFTPARLHDLTTAAHQLAPTP